MPKLATVGIYMAKRDQEKKKMQRANKNSDRASQAEAATQTKRCLDENLFD